MSAVEKALSGCAAEIKLDQRAIAKIVAMKLAETTGLTGAWRVEFQVDANNALLGATVTLNDK